MAQIRRYEQSVQYVKALALIEMTDARKLNIGVQEYMSSVR